MRKKQRLYNKAKRTTQLTDWIEYQSIQSQVGQSICAEHQEYIAKIFISSVF